MLIRPAPFPDEFAAGYLGRIIQLNGWRDQKQAAENLQQWTGNSGSSLHKVTYVQMLAEVADIPTNQFVNSHTLLPLRGAVANGEKHLGGNWSESTGLLWGFGLRTIKPGFYLCPNCVNEDLDFHGVSYWRREHQVPGRFMCSKHAIPLCLVNDGLAYLSTPSQSLQQATLVDEKWVMSLNGNLLIDRFLSICDSLLAVKQPMDEMHVSRRATLEAAKQGLHTGRGRNTKPLLSDKLHESFDERWLAAVMPGMVEKKIGKYWLPLDAVLRGKRSGCSTLSYVLAYTLLFEDSDAAVNVMRDQSSIDWGKPIKNKEVLNVDKLKEKYVQFQGNHQKVAIDLGMDLSRVSYALSNAGLPRLGALNAGKLFLVMNDVLFEGATLQQACQMHGVNPEYARRAILVGLRPLRDAIEEMAPTKRTVKGSIRKPYLPPTVTMENSVTGGKQRSLSPA